MLHKFLYISILFLKVLKFILFTFYVNDYIINPHRKTFFCVNIEQGEFEYYDK